MGVLIKRLCNLKGARLDKEYEFWLLSFVKYYLVPAKLHVLEIQVHISDDFV